MVYMARTVRLTNRILTDVASVRQYQEGGVMVFSKSALRVRGSGVAVTGLRPVTATPE